MQSIPAQYRKQDLSNADCHLHETLQSVTTNIDVALHHERFKQIDLKNVLISSQLASINNSSMSFKYALNELKTLGESMKNTRECEPLKARISALHGDMYARFKIVALQFCEEMNSRLKIALDWLNDLDVPGVGLPRYEERSPGFGIRFITQCKLLETEVRLQIAGIMSDIEAVSTQEARAPVDTRESENMEIQNRALTRKAEDQSLEDEPASSKFKSDAQPAVAESAYKPDAPDTMLSSATVSSAESKVGMFHK